MSDIIDSFWDNEETRATFARECIILDDTDPKVAFRQWVLMKLRLPDTPSTMTQQAPSNLYGRG